MKHLIRIPLTAVAIIGLTVTLASIKPPSTKTAVLVSHVEAVQPSEKSEPAVIAPAPVETQEPAPTQAVEPINNPEPVATPAVPTTHEEMMAAAGIAPGDYYAVEYIVSHESGWRYNVRNNEGSGAYGLCQALPAEKMASAGPDWETNPVTQLKWCTSYASSRYGGWGGAYSHWINSHWW